MPFAIGVAIGENSEKVKIGEDTPRRNGIRGRRSNNRGKRGGRGKYGVYLVG